MRVTRSLNLSLGMARVAPVTGQLIQLPLSAEQQAAIVGATTSAVDDADTDEDALRAQEILVLVREITSTIGPSETTFHRFVSDFHGWDEEDPPHLWLTQEQATALTQRGIVTPLGTT